jgi:hypothetical protein
MRIVLYGFDADEARIAGIALKLGQTAFAIERVDHHESAGAGGAVEKAGRLGVARPHIVEHGAHRRNNRHLGAEADDAVGHGRIVGLRLDYVEASDVVERVNLWCGHQFLEAGRRLLRRR